MPRVVTAVHQLAAELDLTNDELLAALEFLGEVGRAGEFILLSDVLGVSRLVDDATHRGVAGTSSNVLGPFYREGAPLISNPGSIASPRSAGEPLVISGRITDAIDGSPIRGATVDVWQADGDGRYSNEDDRLEPWDLRGRQRPRTTDAMRSRRSGPGTTRSSTTGPLGGC